MTKLLVNPSVSGFAATPGSNVTSVQLEGGPGRYRLDKLGTTHEVQVTWVLTDQGFDYFMAFYRTEIDQGSLAFTVDIKGLDAAGTKTYTAHIVPKTLQIPDAQNGIHTVRATLEVTPQAVNETADAALIAAGPGD